MIMEKNDNLQHADGNENEPLENAMVQESQPKNPEEGMETVATDSESHTAVKQGSNKTSDKKEDDSTTHEDAIVAEKDTVEKTEDPIVEVDEDEEDENDQPDAGAKEIPEKDYDSMEMPQLISELRHLMQEYPINSFRSQAEDIKKAFEAADAENRAEEEEKFKEAHPPTEEGTVPEFEYENALASEFHDLHSLYRKQRGQFQRDRRKQQEQNLKRCLST